MRKWGMLSLLAMLFLVGCNDNNDNAQQNTPMDNAERDVEQFGDDVESGIDDLGDDVDRGINDGTTDNNGQGLNNGINNGQGTNNNGNNNGGMNNDRNNEVIDEIAPNDNNQTEKDRQLNEGR